MKKLLFLLAAVGMLATACENLGIDDPQLPQIEVVGGEESLSLNFPSEGMLTKTVTFKSNYDWSVTTSDAWIKISPESGEAGEECQITVSLDRNETYDVREGKITIGVQELSVDIPVSQQPKNGLMLSNSEVSLPQSGGAFDVAVLSNVDFEYEIKSEWIKAVESRALAESTVRFEAEANPTTDLRTGEILFKGEGLTATLTVTQSQTNVITLSTSTVEIDGKGGTFSIDVLANVEYEVAIEEGCDWISRADSRAMTESILNFTVSENNTDAARSATISISGEGVEENITVRQECVASIPKNTIYYTSSDGAVVTPYAADVFGVNIVSNTYENGQGVITFDGEVTRIGEQAFYNCATLTSISISSTISEMNKNAFSGCKNLKRVDISYLSAWCKIAFKYSTASSPLYNSADLYLNGELLTDLVIPSDITVLNFGAFYGCTSLKSVTIPSHVTSIGKSAFCKCTSLTNVTMENGVTTLGNSVFAICSGLAEITIPQSVTSIGNEAFFHCTSLTSVTIPDSVTSIGNYAFYRCTSLTSITIPDSVTSIGTEAFSCCSSLTSVTIPDSVTSIGEGAFSRCASLEKFYGKFASADNCCLIVDGVFHTFAAGCAKTEYTIPAGITAIGGRAFYYCQLQTSVTIPDSVTSIGNYAFYYCKSLTSVIIPESVTSIGPYVFGGCSSLTNIYCKPTTPPTAVANSSNYWRAFNGNASGRKIYVPAASIEAYRAAEYWSDYAADMVRYDFEKGEVIKISSEIRYTSSNGAVVEPYATDVFGANIVSNTYENGQGVITFDNEVTQIGEQAFYANSSTSDGRRLTSITIPESVTEIGANPFYYCTALTAFYGKFASADNRCLIVDGVLSSFAPAEFTEYTIPDSVTSIGSYAFVKCTSLKSITIPSSITSIERSAFYGCASLTSVTIPQGVTKIGHRAFCDCTALKEVNCKPTTPPAGGSTMFDNNAADRKIYVPIGSGEAYKAKSYWSDYADYIEEKEF